MEIRRLLIKELKDCHFIPIAEILFIEKIERRCHIFTIDNTYTTNETIGSLLKQLPESIFFLSHRSYILNLTKIAKISTRNQTNLAYFYNSDKVAHVSRLKIKELRQKVNSFL